jgi:hypothetical protein
MDKRIKWAELQPGDIVEFRYEGTRGTGMATRTVLILAPHVRKNNLVHGLELMRNRKIVLDDGDLMRYLPVIGGSPSLVREGEIEDEPYYRVNIDQGAERGLYRSLKGALKEDCFRAFKITELKKAQMKRVTTKSESGLLPESMKKEADKIYEKAIQEAQQEAEKDPSLRKIGDAKSDMENLDESVEAIDENKVIKRVTEEVNTRVAKMMDEIGTLISSDQMGELIARPEFEQIEDGLGKDKPK